MFRNFLVGFLYEDFLGSQVRKHAIKVEEDINFNACLPQVTIDMEHGDITAVAMYIYKLALFDHIHSEHFVLLWSQCQ